MGMRAASSLLFGLRRRMINVMVVPLVTLRRERARNQ